VTTTIYSSDKDTGEVYTTTTVHRVATNNVVDDGAGRTHPVRLHPRRRVDRVPEQTVPRHLQSDHPGNARTCNDGEHVTAGTHFSGVLHAA